MNDESQQEPGGLGTRFTETAASARFLFLSLIVHTLLVFVLAFWSLPTVVDLIVTKLHEAEAALQPFDNNQHQSHEDGQQAWEKLADVKAVDKSVDLIRREVDPINLPNQSEELTPTISVELAKKLPSARVLYTPPPEATRIREPQLTARAMASPSAPVDLDEAAAEVVPREAPEEEKLAQAEQELPKVESPELEASTPEAPRRIPLASLSPIELDEPLPEEATPLKSPDDAPMRDNLSPATAAEITDDAEAPVAPLSKEENIPLRRKDDLQVARASVTVRAATATPRPASLDAPPAANKAPLEAPSDLAGATPTEPDRDLPRPDRSASEAENVAFEPPAELGVKPADADPLPITERTAKIPLIRKDAPPPTIDVPTPREISGPSRPRARLAIGELSDAFVDVPPTFGPIVSQLNRPRAKATRVIYAVDSVGLREMFTMRQSDVRTQYIELLGGTPKSESAVNNGLEWLAAHQNPDGSWSLNNFHANCKGKHANCGGAGNVKSNTAATGLAMLPFLASGQTHKSGKYQKQIAAAANWMAKTQKPNGDLLSAGDAQHMYSHSIAAIAVCELYGMTGDPQLKPVAEKALDFIVKAQHAGTGGWRYTPGQAADTSVVGWAMMALKSGEMAGIAPPKAALDNVTKWLAKVEGNKPVGGLFGYQNASPSPAMTSEGLLCLQFMRMDRNDPRMRAGADYLLKHLPDPAQTGLSTSYYWYYGTQVMYHMQGHYWDAWNEKLRDNLVDTQIKTGTLAGTWDIKDNWETSGGRIYATSLKLLMLEVYYRHLPLYEQLDD